VGCGLGYWIAGAMNGMYRPVFDFPRLRNGIRLGYMGAAMLIALACAVLGTLRGVRRITRLEPAEAMREPAPPAGGKILIERWTAFWRGLDFRWQIVLRSVFRNPARTAIGIVAATFGAATVCMAFGFVNSMSSMIAFQFDRVTRADYRIALKNEVGLDAVRTLRHLAGSARVEPVLDISGTFANGWRSKKGAITGLTEGSRLTVPSEINGQAVPLPARGLLMTRRLALELGLRPGDCVEFTPVKGLRRTLRLPVVKLVDSTLGLSVYAEIGYLCRLLGMEPAANSLLVKTQQSPAQRRSFLHALKTLPALQSADDNRAQRRRITAQFDDSMKGFAVAMIIFAAVIFFGSILNSSLIALEERRREIATFRVLGYQPAEIGAMFLRENLIVNMSGAGLGLPLGWFLLAGMTTQYSNDVYCMPTVIGGASYAYTLALALLFILASQWVIRRQILKLNWSEALSMKE